MPSIASFRSQSRFFLKEERRKFSYVGRALRIVDTAARKWTILWLILIAFQGIIPGATLYLTKWLVDSVSAAVAAGYSREMLEMIIVPAALMGGLLLLSQIMGAFTSWINTAQSEHVTDYVLNLVHAKAVDLDYALFEQTEFYDRLSKVQSQASSRTLSVLQTVGMLLQAAITLLSIGVILFQYGWVLPVVLIISTGPALFVLIYFNKFYHTWWEKNTEEMRRTSYFSGMLTARGTAAELRMYRIAQYMRDRFNTLRRRLRWERIDIEKNKLAASVLSGVFALLATAGIMAWMVVRALHGMATLGDLALFYQAFNRGEGIVKTLIGTVAQVHNDTLFLQHLFEFLDEDLERKQGDGPMPVPLRSGIAFERVTFTYPTSSRPAIHDFDISFPAGRTIAVVGGNGAGKSTVTKLICRLFDPESGRVTIDGTDVRTIDPDRLRDQIAIMFQFPVPYQMTVTENIALGQTDPDMDAVRRAADAAGASGFIARLPNGYDTQLGRGFTGGMELSGGEWQRIALARAYYKPAEVYILDEPTSFMDSWAEHDWLERFKRLADGKTVIIITHRFTTAMQADFIHLMDQGQVVESGTHQQLLAQGGLYAESWNAQMKTASAAGALPPEGDGASPFGAIDPEDLMEKR